jgi:hypothetical protein
MAPSNEPEVDLTEETTTEETSAPKRSITLQQRLYGLLATAVVGAIILGAAGLISVSRLSAETKELLSAYSRDTGTATSKPRLHRTDGRSGQPIGA